MVTTADRNPPASAAPIYSQLALPIAHDKQRSTATTMDENNLPSVEGIDLIDYVDESQLDDVMRLVGQDLSEPYSSEFC